MLSTTTCVHFSLNGIWLFLHNIECSVIRLFGHYCKYISLVLEKISCVVLMLHAIVIHSTTFSSTFRRSAFCAKKHKDHIHLLAILFLYDLLCVCKSYQYRVNGILEVGLKKLPMFLFYLRI